MSNIYEVKQFSGGISDYDDRGITGSFKHGSGLNIRKQVDSLSCNQALKEEGLHSSHSPSLSASPSSSISSSPSASFSPSSSLSFTPSPSSSQSPSSSASLSASPSPSSSISPSPSFALPTGTVFADLIRFFVNCSDGYTYGFGNTGYVYRRDTDAFWQIMYKDPDGEIKGAEEKPSFGGKIYLEWCTDTKIKRKEIPGLNDWSDVNAPGTVQGDTWPKTNLNSAEWHTMKQVGGDVMIANKSFLAMSAYDDSYTNEALDLIPGNVAVTLVERDGRVVIGTANASDLEGGINGAIDTELPLAQIGNDGQLIYADMTNNVSIKRFPGGGRVNPGGVSYQGGGVNFYTWEITALSYIDKQTIVDMALFGIYGADTGKNGIWSYGRLNKNKPIAMNLEYQMDVDEIGALTNTNGVILASYRDGTDFGVRSVDPDNKATGIYEGLDFGAPVTKPIDITPWNQTVLILAPLPTGTSIEFWYKRDKDGVFIQAKTADGQDNFSTVGAKKAVFRMGAEAEIFEPRVVLNPRNNSCPEIYKIRTFFA